jgi:hypothetical protein
LGSREQLLHLLAEAAEIEHTIMCSYLYAALSMKRRGDEGLTDEQGEAVERWRKAIMSVAIEEMGHLLVVANLTLALGGRPHFARPNFPIAPGHFPAAIIVRLRGFSREVLDHFIFLERPKGLPGEDADTFDAEDYSRSQAVIGLMPVMQDYKTIGHLYEAIRANILSLARSLGEDGLFIGGVAGQLEPEDFGIEGVSIIGDVPSAMAAIDFVVEQGEGSPSDREVSHYQTFLSIREELDAFCSADGAVVAGGRRPGAAHASGAQRRTPDRRPRQRSPARPRLRQLRVAVAGTGAKLRPFR